METKLYSAATEKSYKTETDLYRHRKCRW